MTLLTFAQQSRAASEVPLRPARQQRGIFPSTPPPNLPIMDEAREASTAQVLKENPTANFAEKQAALQSAQLSSNASTPKPGSLSYTAEGESPESNKAKMLKQRRPAPPTRTPPTPPIPGARGDQSFNNPITGKITPFDPTRQVQFKDPNALSADEIKQGMKNIEESRARDLSEIDNDPSTTKETKTLLRQEAQQAYKDAMDPLQEEAKKLSPEDQKKLITDAKPKAKFFPRLTPDKALATGKSTPSAKNNIELGGPKLVRMTDLKSPSGSNMQGEIRFKNLTHDQAQDKIDALRKRRWDQYSKDKAVSDENNRIRAENAADREQTRKESPTRIPATERRPNIAQRAIKQVKTSASNTKTAVNRRLVR